MPRKLRLLTVSARSTLAADAGLLHCFLDSRLRSAALPRLVTDLIVLPAGQARRVVLASAATLFFAIPLSFVRTERMATPSSSVAAGAGLWRRRFSDLRHGAQLGRDGADL